MSREEEMKLIRKVGLFGLSDLRKIAPIGDLGYANGWYYYHDFIRSELPKAIMSEFYKQGFVPDKGWSSGYRKTDHHYVCTELGLSWSVDSGD